jgi:hypothetical protein
MPGGSETSGEKYSSLFGKTLKNLSNGRNFFRRVMKEPDCVDPLRDRNWALRFLRCRLRFAKMGAIRLCTSRKIDAQKKSSHSV